mgnify:CR=1 FL=1
MRRISFAEISIFVVNRIFNWRFWIAEITKKSKIYRKIIDFTLFKDDEIVEKIRKVVKKIRSVSAIRIYKNKVVD